MKGRVTAIVKNEKDRTADLTVEVSLDNGTLIQTDNIILPVDILSRDLANERVKEHLKRVIVGRKPFPFTDQQLNDLLLNMVTVVPE